MTNIDILNLQELVQRALAQPTLSRTRTVLGDLESRLDALAAKDQEIRARKAEGGRKGMAARWNKEIK